MPTPTTRLRARLIDSGAELNTWGTNLNDQVFTLLDEAIAGVEKITLSGNLTLSSANYATDQARNAALIFQGSPAAAVTVTIPSVEKVYVCSNQTAQSVTVKAGGTGVALAAGDRAVIWCDGTDCGLGSISATTVNGLIANAQLAGANLPGQTGNAGKYLQTDGAVPLWAEIPIPDVGGGADATITASATLAAAASVVQSVDMATAAQSVKLPDATLLTKGGRKYVVLNVGNRTFGIRDNANALLTVLPAGASAELHLRDNSTAAGAWGVTGRGLEPALTLIDHTAPTTIASSAEVVCRLTDTLSLHFGLTTADIYAVAIDSTPGAAAVGTWTNILAGSATIAVPHCFRVSDTQAIVFYTSNSGGALHYARVLTVDPATKAITVGTAASVAAGTATMLQDVTFSGRPLIAQMTASLYVILWKNAGSANPARAIAVSVSGSTATIGTPTAAIATGSAGHEILACYRVSDMTALAIYTDDSGTAGSPYSIRAAVLTVSGTNITVGASAGINDVVTSAVFPTCQLSATKYLVGYNNIAGTAVFAAAVTVSGTGVTFGTPLTVETVASPSAGFASGNANRFQNNLFRISDTAALFTYVTSGGGFSRHVVLTENGGTLTSGGILYSLFGDVTGGNFPQTPQGFLAFSKTAATSFDMDSAVFNVAISGTSLSVVGTRADPDASITTTAQGRFGLSGGVFGAYPQDRYSGNTGAATTFALFRRPNDGPPVPLGFLPLNDFRGTTAAEGSLRVPVEIATNKAAFIGISLTQPAATGNSVRLLIVEFASL